MDPIEKQNSERIVQFINMLHFISEVKFAGIDNHNKVLYVVFKEIKLDDFPKLIEMANASTDYEDLIDLNSAFSDENIQKTIQKGGKQLYFDLLTDQIDPIDQHYKEGGSIQDDSDTPVDQKYSSDTLLNDFYMRLAEEGELHKSPFERDVFLFDNKAIVNLNRYGLDPLQNSINLDEIRVVERGRGHGKELLEKITKIADDLDVTIELFAKPLGRFITKTDKQALLEFYQKAGFEVNLDAYGYEQSAKEHIEEYLDKNSDLGGIYLIRTPK